MHQRRKLGPNAVSLPLLTNIQGILDISICFPSSELQKTTSELGVISRDRCRRRPLRCFGFHLIARCRVASLRLVPVAVQAPVERRHLRVRALARLEPVCGKSKIGMIGIEGQEIRSDLQAYVIGHWKIPQKRITKDK